MAVDNQLQARVQPSHAEYLDDIAGEGPRTEAEREVIQEGLAAMGYVTRPTGGADLWLYYTRYVGLSLGLAGLAGLGMGAFLGSITGVYGFGLVILGFLIVAASDGLRAAGDRLGGPE